jgi:hypothetical protein
LEILRRAQARAQGKADDSPPVSFHGIPVPKGGCFAETTQKLQQGAKPAPQIDVQQLAGESNEHMKNDGRVKDPVGKWAACMQARGYQYKDPSEPVNDSRFSGPITAVETKTATDDVQCRKQVNLNGLMLAVETAYQNEIINKHAQELAQIKENQRIVTANAQRVLSGGSGT